MEMKTLNFFPNRHNSVLVLMLLIIVSFNGMSQPTLKKSNSDKQFSTLIKTEGYLNYYSIDLDQLPGFFERGFLLDLIFADSDVVVDQTIISGSSLIVFSNAVNDPKQILDILAGFKEKSIIAGKSLKYDEKESLLKKYEKYR
jgi:hypothetical protein